MIINAILNLATYLTLTFSSPATFIFDSPIDYYVISNESDFKMYKSKDGKILTIKPYKNNIESRLLVITKEGVFPFELNVSSESRSQVYTMKLAEIGQSYFSILKKDDYELFESEKSYMLKITGSKVGTVNGMEAKNIQYLPKNGRVKIDGIFVK